MDAKLTWQGSLKFIGTADSGFSVVLDTDEAVGGTDTGFRPMEFMAMGLAGCTAMDVMSIMKKKRQDVTDFVVKVHADQAPNHPKAFTKAVIEYFVTGHGIDEAAVVRSIELSAVRYCPAQAMLNKVIPIQLKYYIYEDKGDQDPELVTTGEYVPPQPDKES